MNSFYELPSISGRGLKRVAITAAMILLVASLAHAQTTATMVSPTDGSTVSGTITISASISGPYASVVFWRDNWIQIGQSSGPQLSYNSGALANGNHQFFITVLDSGGNTLCASNIVTVSVQNSGATTATMVSPADGSTVSGTITISASISGPYASVVFWRDNWLQIGQNPSPQLSYDTSSLSSGSHQFFFSVLDSAGNTLAASNIVTVTVQSGGSFITIPGNATTFSDMDDPVPSGAAWSAWNDCGGCSGNPGGDAQHSNVFNSDSTAPDGQARQFAITTNSSQFQGFLWYSHFPSLNSTNWVFDYYVKISDPGNQGAVELDGNQTSPDGLNNFVFGTECNYGANSAQATIWRFWTKDASGERWFDSSLNCALTAAGDWYHVQMHFDVLANNQYRVDEVVITDVTTNVVVTNTSLGLVLNGVGSNTGHGNSMDIQLDGVNNNNYSATYSKLSVSRW